MATRKAKKDGDNGNGNGKGKPDELLALIYAVIESEEKLNAKKGWKGAHVVFSGLNQVIRSEFKADPREVIDGYVAEGKLESKLAKKGIRVFRPGEAPKPRESVNRAAGVLAGLRK